MPLDVHGLQSFYGSPLGAVARRLIGRVLRERWENCLQPLRRRGRLRNAISRPDPRRRQAMPRAHAGGTGRGASGREAADARRRLWTRECCRCPTARSIACCLAHALEAADRPERVARGAVARHRAGGTNPRDRRPLPSRGLGARGQHALRAGPALFEAAAPRSPSPRGILANLLGRGALCAAGRAAVHDPRRRRRSNASARRFNCPFAGVHIVEAIKQVYRPVGVRKVARARLAPLKPVLAPSAQRQRHSE